MRNSDVLGVLLMVLAPAAATVAEDGTVTRFAFGASRDAGGAILVDAQAAYSDARGHGFEPGPSLTIDQSPAGDDIHAITSNQPFSFSVLVPEGNYRVTLRLGNPNRQTDTTVKAESRRLMLPAVRCRAGEIVTHQFSVNVRTPRIRDGVDVALNSRETNPPSLKWDNKLTLEFCGPRPSVVSIEVRRADDVVTLFLAGDSTVCDQSAEPWIGWGQMLPQFFGTGVSVANHAESGRTLRSFKGDRRWDKILSQLKPGDFVFIQFGHNDMKETGDGIGAFTSYAASLRQYLTDVRERGGNPVLLTPMNRRRFKDNQIVNTFGDYPDAVRNVAREMNVPLIDLFAMSKPLYEALGTERSKQMFVHFPAGTFAGQTEALKDDTHFQAYGGDQLARCVVQGIRDAKLPLADHLRPGTELFDPAKPIEPNANTFAPSAAGTIVVPEGR